MQIEEKRKPGCRLVLGDRSNDRYVDFGVTGIPKRIESADQLREFKEARDMSTEAFKNFEKRIIHEI